MLKRYVRIENEQDIEINTLSDLRAVVKQHSIVLGKNIKLGSVWGRKFASWFGKTKDGFNCWTIWK